VVVNPCFSFLTPYEPAHVDQDALQPYGPENSASASNFTIRRATAQDVSTLAEILTDSFHPQTGFMRWASPMLRLGIYEDLRHRLRSQQPHYLCLVAVATVSTVAGCCEELIGTVEVTLRSTSSWPSGSSEYPYISNLAVRKSCRRQGAARQLLLACEQASLEWGFSEIYLHVIESNHQARQLYLKLGYQLHRVESSYGSWLLGRPKRLLLQKPLNFPVTGTTRVDTPRRKTDGDS
jgi:ribosomal protein S18 acetylase RimI-like enzyme